MANATPHTLVQVPPGVQCFFGDEARRRRAIEERVVAVFEGWDYGEIIPPLYDYADVFASRALGARTYSFVGRDGSLLALRPDFTALLAKIAAGRLAHRPAPLRLYYSGEVLRYEPPKAGRQNELYQMGLEHLGGERAVADAEVLAVAAECLEQAGVSGFLLALGHVGVFAGLTERLALDAAALDTLRERVEGKSAEGVREVLGRAGAPRDVVAAVARLVALDGDAGVLAEARAALRGFDAAQAALEELDDAVRALTEAGLGRRISVDLGEVRGFDYYTGLVFRVFAPGLGFEVGGGGRYDGLLGRFGRPLPAVGFMLGLDRLALLLDRQRSGTAPPSEPSAQAVDARDVGAGLRAAREWRAQGRRVRFGNGRGGTR